MEKKRNVSMDALRILCAFSIVMIHVTPDYHPEQNWSFINLLIQSAVRPGLPLFFIISGYFILNGKVESLFSFYKKRVVSIIVPFIIFSFLHYNYFHHWDSDAYSMRWAANYLKSIIIGSPENFGRDYFMTGLYWFVYSILGLYLISPAIKLCISFVCEESANRYFIIFFVSYASYETLKIASPEIGLSDNLFFLPENTKWLFYFVLGGILHRTSINLKIKVHFLAVVLAYVIVLITCKGSAYGEWYSSSWIDSNPAMAMLSVSIFMVFKSINIKTNYSLVGYLSSLTYGVYLIHITILSIVSNAIDSFSLVGIFKTLIIGFSVFTLSMAFVGIVNFFVINRVLRLLN